MSNGFRATTLLPVARLPYPSSSTRANPIEIKKNGTSCEEWLFLLYNCPVDGSVLIYRQKRALGDPTSVNISHHTFIAGVRFPNGTLPSLGRAWGLQLVPAS